MEGLLVLEQVDVDDIARVRPFKALLSVLRAGVLTEFPNVAWEVCFHLGALTIGRNVLNPAFDRDVPLRASNDPVRLSTGSGGIPVSSTGGLRRCGVRECWRTDDGLSRTRDDSSDHYPAKGFDHDGPLSICALQWRGQSRLGRTIPPPKVVCQHGKLE